jgi:hypothetical protein
VKNSGLALCLLIAAIAPALGQEARGSEAGEGPGKVVVLNSLERAVTIWINGQLKGKVAAGDDATFGRVPSGRLRLQAGGVGAGGPVAFEERVLAPGETFKWTLYPVLSMGEEKGTGTLVLVNSLSESVEIRVADRPAGSLAPRGSRAYPRIVSGQVQVEARNANGETLAQQTLDVKTGKISRWVIGGKGADQSS